MTVSIKTFIAALVILLLQPLAPVSAKQLLSYQGSHSEIRVVAERDSLVIGETTWLAIEITPRDGWHTYWKNPGDSGAAPILKWGETPGLTFGTPEFAAPSRIPVEQLVNYGFTGPSVILLPVTVAADQMEGDTTLEFSAEWLVCEVECVPQVGDWRLTVPIAANASLSLESQALFTAARAKLPEMAYWDAELLIADVSSELTVYADRSELEGLRAVYFYPESEGVASYSGTQVWSFTDDSLLVRIPRDRSGVDPVGANGVLQLDFETSPSQYFALEPGLKVAEQAGPDGVSVALLADSVMPLWQAAIYAFLGGLILNLMPCVFPILSLKAFAFVAANYKTEAHRRKEGWAYTFGIWISFMVIVAALMILRAGGAAIGWGFQLQDPLFVGLLALLMVLVALSLAGVFTIQLSFQGAGQQFAGREGAQGAFFKGVLATLVATPCTAPLMAPAIGFALTQPIYTVVIVFSLLAFGLALPFLLLSYSARVAAMMPKPGPWMEKVKQGLAFPMLLTAVWLVYVYDLQAGATATFILLAGSVFVAFGVWLWGKSTGIIVRAIALLALIGSIAVIIDYSETAAPDVSPEAEAANAYSDARLSGLLDEGKPVFVYFTAEWCITCKVNERMALNRDDTQAALKAKGVTVLKGDWTNKNDEIAAVLARYGRAGVPLYLYFPAGKREAIVLPEIITSSSIIDIL